MKFIVSYNKQFDIDGKIETFEGFSLKYLIHKFRYRDEFKIIDIEQFNSTKFSEEDIVIIAVFNRNKLQFQHKMITEKIKEMFGDNLYRKNTFLVLGTHAEAQGNDVRGDEKLTNEEAYNNLLTQQDPGRVNQIADKQREQEGGTIDYDSTAYLAEIQKLIAEGDMERAQAVLEEASSLGMDLSDQLGM